MANPSTAQIQAWIVAAAAQYGVDSSLALGVAQQESGFNPDALSSAGAIGVMQLEPSTAIQLGVDPTDPQQNIYGGVHYLAMLLSEFGGDEVAALAAYNWGPGAVSNAQNEYGPTWLAMAPAETQNYVSRILGVSAASYEAMESPLAPAAAAVASTSTDAEDIDSTDEDAALLSSIGVSTGVAEPPAPTLANWLASLPSWSPYAALAAAGIAAFALID
jgi:hypothetical protein